MADDDFQVAETTTPAKKATTRKTAARKSPAKKSAGVKAPDKLVSQDPFATADAPAPAKKAPAKKAAAKKTPAKKAASKKAEPKADPKAEPKGDDTRPATGTMLLFQPPEQTVAPVRRSRKVAQSAQPAPAAGIQEGQEGGDQPDESGESAAKTRPSQRQRPARKAAAKAPSGPDADEAGQSSQTDQSDSGDSQDDNDDDGDGAGRRRRRRGGRRRRKPGEGDAPDSSDESDGQERSDAAQGGDTDQDGDQDGDGTSRRRRRRRRSGDAGGEGGEGSDDPQNTVTRVRRQRSAEDEITAISGSTRLEAKKQRRRDGREAGRRRAPIVSEAEFLARREAVERVMVIRQRDELTQIGVLEDKVLVEHYVARESQISLIGNVYLGRVQNVLPSMEAAFIDIGKGRNAVLYAGEVNWSALGQGGGGSRKIESVLSSGQSILVQVTKDPIGQKGARLTSQVSLAGRFLVYVPDGTTSGISRKLPDTERSRLKALLKEIVPDTAGVIVRTAAEGASEDELTRDVERLKARWDDIEAKLKGNSPQLLYGEPDLTLKVVRDLFTEDFAKLVIEGDDAWDTVTNYVGHVAPDLQDRVERFDGGGSGKDIFATYRVNEQIAKGLDRKVWLPSGGSLVIDRTEAMTVVDVNTGKFTGSGGNLEETVTKNNLEAAEEMVRQLRLRDIGGIIVIDFIDMVLESNRDLVLRRLVECLGRDRTRHQVAEVTSLGLVQMTRKRIGTGLVESFSHNCEHCQGRGVVIEDAPVEPRNSDDDSPRGGRRNRGGRGGSASKSSPPSPKDVAAMAKHEPVDPDEPDEPVGVAEPVSTLEEPESSVAEPEAPKVVTRSRRRSASRPAAAPLEDGHEDSEDSAPTPAEPIEPEPPKVVTRSRRRSASRPAAAPPEDGHEESEDSAPTPAEPIEPEPTQPEPTQPEPPKVVTRSRRRSASRPAAAPAVTSTPEPVQSAEAVPVAVAAQPPKVITRTRTRGSSASRPAGPPASEPTSTEGVEHVPIKKKGTRKR